jgi:predicted permease
MALPIQLSFLLPLAVFGAVAVGRQWSHWKLLGVYAGVVILMAIIGGLTAPKFFWQGARLGGVWARPGAGRR